MISAARTIIHRNPGIKRVLVLDRTPRFDVEAVDPLGLKSKLSEYGNRVFREELAKSDVKDQVSIASHFLPKQFQETLYGHPQSQFFDGIHLGGSDGKNHYTRSLCNIFQGFLCEHSRENHNHVIPTTSNSASTSRSSTFSTPSSSSSSSFNSSAKPAYVVIDIESTDPEQPHQYTIPTYNSFSALGN